MLSLSSLSVKSVAVIYDRLSTKGQIVSFETHLPILRSAVANSEIKFDEIYEVTEIGSAFNNHKSLQLHSILDQKNIHIFIYDQSRLSRDLEAAGGRLPHDPPHRQRHRRRRISVAGSARHVPARYAANLGLE